MSTSQLRALYMIDPEEAREKILKAFEDNDGYGSRAAVDLEVDYQTLARFIKSDPKLAKAVLKLKERLAAEGHPQHGFGDLARQKLSEYQDNPRPYSD